MIFGIYSAEHELWNKGKNNLSVILLDIMRECECSNDQMLYISNDLEQMHDLKQINLCSLYALYEYVDNAKTAKNLTIKHMEHLNKCLVLSMPQSMSSSPNEKGIELQPTF